MRGVTLNLDDKRGSSRIDTIDTALTCHSRAETAEWRAFLDTTMAFMLLLFVVRMLIIRNAEHISDFMTVIEVLTMSPPDTTPATPKYVICSKQAQVVIRRE